MRKNLQVTITRASNGFIIRSMGDEPKEDNEQSIAASAEEASKIAVNQITKSLAEKPQPQQ